MKSLLFRLSTVFFLISSGYVYATSPLSGVCSGSPLTSEQAIFCSNISAGGSAAASAESGFAAGQFGLNGQTGSIFNLYDLTDDDNSEDKSAYNSRHSGGAAGDILSTEKFGFFISAKGEVTDRQNTSRELGYDAESAGFVTGLDFQFSDQLLGGLAIGYSDSDADFDKSGGDLDNETVSVTVFGTYMPIDDLSVNGYVGWSGSDLDRRRKINAAGIVGHADGDTESDQFLAGLGARYDFVHKGLSISPEVLLEYSDTWIDGYSEKGTTGLNLRIGDQAIHSFKSLVGFNTAYAFSQSWGVVIPQLRFFHVHEYNNDSRSIHMNFVGSTASSTLKTDDPDRDYFTFGFGVSAVLTHSVQVFIDYEKMLDHEYINTDIISGGLRVGF